MVRQSLKVKRSLSTSNGPPFPRPTAALADCLEAAIQAEGALLNRSAEFIDQLQTSVVLLTEDLTVAGMNSAAEILFGVSAKRLKGKFIGKAWANVNDYQELFAAAVRKRAPISQHDVSLVTNSGSRRTFNCAVSPLVGDGWNHQLLVEIAAVDVSPTMLRDAENRAFHDISDGMLRGFAHEVKNPLGGLRGAAQLLDRELPNEELREYTAVILAEADRMTNLVNRMLARNAVPEMVPVNLHQVLERVHVLVSAELPEQVGISTDYDPSIPEIMGDKELLIQGVLNIVRNAMQALIEAGGGGSIVIRSRVKRNMTIGTKRHRFVAQVDVTDDGPGVPAELQEQIFYPLITGRAEGTGLGLPIAQSLISQQGGLVSFVSQPGCTVFSIYLTIAELN